MEGLVCDLVRVTVRFGGGGGALVGDPWSSPMLISEHSGSALGVWGSQVKDRCPGGLLPWPTSYQSPCVFVVFSWYLLLVFLKGNQEGNHHFGGGGGGGGGGPKNIPGLPSRIGAFLEPGTTRNPRNQAPNGVPTLKGSTGREDRSTGTRGF